LLSVASHWAPPYLRVRMLHHKEVSAVTVIHKCQCNNQGSSVALEPDQERNHDIQSMVTASQIRYTYPVKTFGTRTKLCNIIHCAWTVEDSLSSCSKLQLTNVGLWNETPVTNNTYIEYFWHFLNRALWYTYVIRTNKMHTFYINVLI
jgi:hypothetical protein